MVYQLYKYFIDKKLMLWLDNLYYIQLSSHAVLIVIYSTLDAMKSISKMTSSPMKLTFGGCGTFRSKPR